MQKINHRLYTSLTRSVLATLPCYCRGLIAIRRAPPFVTKTPVSIQPPPSGTPQPTTCTTTTVPTETMTPTPTYTVFIPPSLTPSFNSAPTPTGSFPSITSTVTVTKTVAPTSSATHTITGAPFQRILHPLRRHPRAFETRYCSLFKEDYL